MIVPSSKLTKTTSTTLIKEAQESLKLKGLQPFTEN